MDNIGNAYIHTNNLTVNFILQSYSWNAKTIRYLRASRIFFESFLFSTRENDNSWLRALMTMMLIITEIMMWTDSESVRTRNRFPRELCAMWLYTFWLRYVYIKQSTSFGECKCRENITEERLKAETREYVKIGESMVKKVRKALSSREST